MKEHTSSLSPEGAKEIVNAAYIGVLMIKHLIALTTGEWIAIAAIAVPVIVAAIVGLLKWLLGKKVDPKSNVKTIHQEGSGHTAGNIDGDKNIIAGGNVNTGIDSDAALNTLVKTSKELGQAKEKIKQLEEQLAQPQRTIVSGEPQIPQPTQEAKDLAAQIDDDTGPYALALKAIAEGNSQQAEEFLDQTQQFLDQVQQQKDLTQPKVYIARMQNASYAGRPQDALPYCAKLKPLADDDSLILNDIATVYYENAKYNDAEPLMRKSLEIDKKSLGPDHPNVAIRLNNLAQLLKATNRLTEAEPLMRRALAIDEKSFGPDHPDVAIHLNNLAQLLQDTNRLDDAEPMYRRALAIDEKSLGPDHPNVARDLNNLAGLLQATNRLDEAEPMYRRALGIMEKSLGPDHPNTQTIRNNLENLRNDLK